MTKIRKKRMKGNSRNSRRRRQQRQRIIVIAISTASCLFVCYILGLIIPRPRGDEDGNDNRIGPKLQKQEAPQPKRLRDAKTKRRAATKREGLLPMRKALEDAVGIGEEEDFDPEATDQARQILSASANLIAVGLGPRSSVRDNSYTGVIAEFCPINFAPQKENPPEVPMFRDVLARSHCDEDSGNIIRVDLKEAVELARKFDRENTNNLPVVLDLKGAVFHESRCGSTLAANSMMALNPEKHRVYSESAPPISALRSCGDDYANCSIKASANLLKDIIYLMGRSNDPKEENLFFKFQSATTRNLETFREAFPTTPWVFLYRKPIEVMMSQLDVPHTSNANCVRSKNSSPMIRKFIDKSAYKFEDFTNVEFCAVHLATLCESALRNLEDAAGLGMAVNYSPHLVDRFLDTIFPKHFHTPVDNAGRDRVMKISGTYSKNRGRHAEEFKPDSEEKERNASGKIKDAATDFLQPSFDKLQKSDHNIIPFDGDDDNDEEE